MLFMLVCLNSCVRYKHALKKCFKKQGKAVVYFERNYRTQHLQIQVRLADFTDLPSFTMGI